MSDAIFNSSGDVNGGSGRIASAWLGPGASAAPSMANILSAAGITPTQTVERHLPTYTYSKPAPVDYQKIADQARADAQAMLGFKDRSELQDYINQQIAAQGTRAQPNLYVNRPGMLRYYQEAGLVPQNAPVANYAVYR